jgi:tRNA(Arg) A34 adenosine deaminase TadA
MGRDVVDNEWTRIGRRRFLQGLGAGGLAAGAAAWLAPRLASTWSGVPHPELPKLDHEKFMRLAIAQAKMVPRVPFGAVIVRASDETVVADGFARVADNPTYHGEMDAINRCAARNPGIAWSSLVLYTTGESCPMCQSAALWAGIAAVVYGTSIPVLQQFGFGQIDIRSSEVVRHARLSPCIVLGGVLEDECTALFRTAWEGQ